MTSVYHILSDPIRRGMISLIAQQQRTQSEIVEAFDVSQPAITKHLKLLKEGGFISESKHGRFRIYHLNASGVSKAYERLLKDMDLLLGKTMVDLKKHVESKEDEDG